MRFQVASVNYQRFARDFTGIWLQLVLTRALASPFHIIVTIAIQLLLVFYNLPNDRATVVQHIKFIFSNPNSDSNKKGTHTNTHTRSKKEGMFSLSRAWDKEKFWVPDGNRPVTFGRCDHWATGRLVASEFIFPRFVVTRFLHTARISGWSARPMYGRKSIWAGTPSLGIHLSSER